MLSVGASQSLSSLTNLIPALLIARLESPGTVGHWAVGMAALQLCQGIARSASAEVAQVHVALKRIERSTLLAAVAPAVWVATLSGPIVLLVSKVLADSNSHLALAVAAASTVVIPTENLRSVYLATGNPIEGAKEDARWLLGTVISLAIVRIAADLTAATITLSWAAYPAVRTLLIARLFLLLPASRMAARCWVREHRKAMGSYILELGAMQLAGPILLLAFSPVLGAAEIGIFRSALVLTAPQNLLLSFLTVLTIPVLAGRAREGRSSKNVVLAVSSIGLGLGLAWWVVLQSSGLGDVLLGANYQLVHETAGVLVGAVAVASASSGAMMALRASQCIRLSVAARWAGAIAIFLGAAVFTAVAPTAERLASALLAGNAAGLLVWWSAWYVSGR